MTFQYILVIFLLVEIIALVIVLSTDTGNCRNHLHRRLNRYLNVKPSIKSEHANRVNHVNTVKKTNSTKVSGIKMYEDAEEYK